MMIVVYIAIGILIGGCAVALLAHFKQPKTMGNLRVDQSDPKDQPYLFLELTADIPSVLKEEYVIFRVRAENYISPK